MFVLTHSQTPGFINLMALNGQKAWHLMANTFSQIYIQTVFAVSGRLSLITQDFKEELHKYISGIVRRKDQKLISINGMADHLHILIGLRPANVSSENVVFRSVSSEMFIDRRLTSHPGSVRSRMCPNGDDRNMSPLRSEVDFGMLML